MNVYGGSAGNDSDAALRAKEKNKKRAVGQVVAIYEWDCEANRILNEKLARVLSSTGFNLDH